MKESTVAIPKYVSFAQLQLYGMYCLAMDGIARRSADPEDHQIHGYYVAKHVLYDLYSMIKRMAVINDFLEIMP